MASESASPASVLAPNTHIAAYIDASNTASNEAALRAIADTAAYGRDMIHLFALVDATRTSADQRVEDLEANIRGCMFRCIDRLTHLLNDRAPQLEPLIKSHILNADTVPPEYLGKRDRAKQQNALFHQQMTRVLCFLNEYDIEVVFFASQSAEITPSTTVGCDDCSDPQPASSCLADFLLRHLAPLLPQCQIMMVPENGRAFCLPRSRATCPLNKERPPAPPPPSRHGSSPSPNSLPESPADVGGRLLSVPLSEAMHNYTPMHLTRGTSLDSAEFNARHGFEHPHCQFDMPFAPPAAPLDSRPSPAPPPRLVQRTESSPAGARTRQRVSSLPEGCTTFCSRLHPRAVRPICEHPRSTVPEGLSVVDQLSNIRFGDDALSSPAGLSSPTDAVIEIMGGRGAVSRGDSDGDVQSARWKFTDAAGSNIAPLRLEAGRFVPMIPDSQSGFAASGARTEVGGHTDADDNAGETTPRRLI